MNLFNVALAVCLALASCAAVARSYDEVIASGYIEIAVYADFPPYSYQGENGASGIDIEIGKRIATQLGVEPRWFWVIADENLEDDLRNSIWKGHYLRRQVADLMLRVPYDREFAFAIDGYGEAKNDMVVMQAPYHRERWTLARNLERVGSVRNLAIFQYEKIGVELDSLPDFFLSGALMGRLRNQVVHFGNLFDAIAALNQGEVSAVAGMRSQIEWGLGERVGDYDIDDDGLEHLSKGAWDIGIAVKHSYRQLGYAVEAVIEELVKAQEMGKIFARYGVSYELPATYQVVDE